MLGMLGLLVTAWPPAWHPAPPLVKVIPPSGVSVPVPRPFAPPHIAATWPPVWYPAQSASPNAAWNFILAGYLPPRRFPDALYRSWPSEWYPAPPLVKLVPPTNRADPPRGRWAMAPHVVGSWPPIWWPSQEAAPNAAWNVVPFIYVGPPRFPQAIFRAWEPPWGPYPKLQAWPVPLGTISGITRDNTGAPLGGCAVHLFRTRDDLEIAITGSDNTGFYSFTLAQGVETYYCVAYKAGVLTGDRMLPTVDIDTVKASGSGPGVDVAGTTLNTLVVT